MNETAMSDYPQPNPPPNAGLPPSVATKSPVLAAVLALFPGIGHVYNGLYVRALTFFLIVASLIAIAQRGHDLAGFAIGFFWLFNVLDSYRQATLINYGYAQDLGLIDLPERPRAGQGTIAAGVLLIVLGLFAFVDRYLHIDLDWLIDLWPLGLVAIGSWLVVAALRERRRGRPPLVADSGEA